MHDALLLCCGVILAGLAYWVKLLLDRVKFSIEIADTYKDKFTQLELKVKTLSNVPDLTKKLSDLEANHEKLNNKVTGLTIAKKL